MNFKLVAILTIVLGALTSDVHAGRHDRRQNRQGARIQQGVKSGELTQGEASRLRQQQRRINRVENRAEADGTVTGAEKARLENMQDRASRNIYRKKHNDRNQNSNSTQTTQTNE